MQSGWVAWIVATPSICAALAVAGMEVTGAFKAESPLVRPQAATFGEAIAAGTVEDAYGFIRAGAEPHAPVPVRHDELTGGVDVVAAPLLIAIAAGNGSAIGLLLGVQPQLDRRLREQAICLAQRTGQRDLAAALEALPPATPAPPCPAAANRPPLLDFVESP